MMKDIPMKELFSVKTTTIDLFGLASFVGVLTQVLPIIAGVLTVVWAMYRIKEIRLAIKLAEKKLKEE